MFSQHLFFYITESLFRGTIELHNGAIVVRGDDHIDGRIDNTAGKPLGKHYRFCFLLLQCRTGVELFTQLLQFLDELIFRFFVVVHFVNSHHRGYGIVSILHYRREESTAIR